MARTGAEARAGAGNGTGTRITGLCMGIGKQWGGGRRPPW